MINIEGKKRKPQINKNNNKAADPRSAALSILKRVEEDKGYSNLLINSEIEKLNLTKRDSAFMTALVYGVLEKEITLDFFISHYAKRGTKGIEPKTLNIMRLGAYQIIFLDKVPPSAAVNESVKLAKKSGLFRAAGFINAVLRRISENVAALPYPDKVHDFKRYLHVRYSLPQWLLTKWINEYGKENTVGILEGIEKKPTAVIRVNTLLIKTDELIEVLKNEGITAKKIDFLDDALELDRLSDLKNSEAFKKGLFFVQNTASQICCLACGVKSGDSVIDMCSAPGGKSFNLAIRMKNKGAIQSLELYDSRLELIKDGAKRLGINIISAKANDASVHNEDLGEADIVLCDVPCSGLGVIGRKPEIRFKDPQEFDGLHDLQYSIICEGATHVKAGGKLVYSTCTLSKAENEEIIKEFLNTHENFKVSLPEEIRSIAKIEDKSTIGATLFPHKVGSDGFFVSVLKKD